MYKRGDMVVFKRKSGLNQCGKVIEIKPGGKEIEVEWAENGALFGKIVPNDKVKKINVISMKRRCSCFYIMAFIFFIFVLPVLLFGAMLESYQNYEMKRIDCIYSRRGFFQSFFACPEKTTFWEVCIFIYVFDLIKYF